MPNLSPETYYMVRTIVQLTKKLYEVPVLQEPFAENMTMSSLDYLITFNKITKLGCAKRISIHNILKLLRDIIICTSFNSRNVVQWKMYFVFGYFGMVWDID